LIIYSVCGWLLWMKFDYIVFVVGFGVASCAGRLLKLNFRRPLKPSEVKKRPSAAVRALTSDGFFGPSEVRKLPTVYG
jgi:hypothetical protein